MNKGETEGSKKKGISIEGWPALIIFIVCFCLPINLCNRVKRLEKQIYQTDTIYVKQIPQTTNGHSITS